MSDKKTKIRFFTIADFADEEKWLREQHAQGWKFTGMTVPCFYHFEKAEPEDVIYRLDFKYTAADPEYHQLFMDYGWEPCGQCIGWYYFRKSASNVENENDAEIFSDNESKYNMVKKIFLRRLLPIIVIFLCCIVTQLLGSDPADRSVFFIGFFSILSLVYIVLIVHCASKLLKIRKELSDMIDHL